MILNSTMGGTLPFGTITTIEKKLGVQDSELLVLPVSRYLIGFILGPLVFAPLSEAYGRKMVMIGEWI
jgi:MFS family permease